jgi:hypothetical protein
MARLSGTNVVLTTTATGRQVGAGSSCFDEHLLAAGLRYTGGGFTGCCAALLASRACQFRRLPKGGELSADLTDLRRGYNIIMLNRIPGISWASICIGPHHRSFAALRALLPALLWSTQPGSRYSFPLLIQVLTNDTLQSGAVARRTLQLHARRI